jgi:RNA polymerase sigma factor for flagellar operon FliA
MCFGRRDAERERVGDGSGSPKDDVASLVRRYRALADQLTSVIQARVPRSVDRGDLHSAAMLGLFQAAQAWEPDRSVSFETFARHRIRGALLDELRNRDWASRRSRTLSRNVSAAHDELTSMLGRCPTDGEIAGRLGVSVESIATNQRHIHMASLRSSDELHDEARGVVSVAADGPEAVLEQREQSAYLHDAVALLPDRLRRVIVGYYVEEQPMAALADELGVTESRVSQMRAEAVRILRAALSGALDPDRVNDVAFGEYVSQRALDIAEHLRTAGDPRERLGVRLS